MTNENDNAYPSGAEQGVGREYGLTKRELFAAMAMQGYCGNAEFIINPTAAAITAVQTADALIAELNKEVQS